MAEETDVTAVLAQLYGILKPLEADDRRKVIKATLTLLGDGAESVPSNSGDRGPEASTGDSSALPSKVRLWMQQTGLAEEHLNHVFHSDGGTVAVIIGAAPGANLREKTLNAYVLTGISLFLQTGEAKFDDKVARDVCKSLGCLNEGNHAKYMKEKGNLFSGSKAGGWTLTAPGLKAGAEIIKGLVAT